jgi:hypothetical protein
MDDVLPAYLLPDLLTVLSWMESSPPQSSPEQCLGLSDTALIVKPEQQTQGRPVAPLGRAASVVEPF